MPVRSNLAARAHFKDIIMETKNRVRFDDMDAEEADLRVRALLKESGLEITDMQAGELAKPEPECYGLERFPKSRTGQTGIKGMNVTWNWLMSYLEAHRNINGRVLGVCMESIGVYDVPRRYFEVPSEVQASEAYGVRPGEGCEMKAVVFYAEGEPPLSAAVNMNRGV